MIEVHKAEFQPSNNGQIRVDISISVAPKDFVKEVQDILQLTAYALGCETFGHLTQKIDKWVGGD